MKLGLGLYRHQLTVEHYRFAKQCGCTQIGVHLVDCAAPWHAGMTFALGFLKASMAQLGD